MASRQEGSPIREPIKKVIKAYATASGFLLGVGQEAAFRLCRPEIKCGAILVGGRPLFRGGLSLVARAGVDVKIGVGGMVNPGRGIYVNLSPAGLEKYGGARQVMAIPNELELVQRGANPNHYEIAPRQPMTLEKYQGLLNLVKLK